MSMVADILAKATADAEARLETERRAVAAPQDVEKATQEVTQEDVAETPEPATTSRVQDILNSVLNATQDEPQVVVETPEDVQADVQADDVQDDTDALEDVTDALEAPQDDVQDVTQDTREDALQDDTDAATDALEDVTDAPEDVTGATDDNEEVSRLLAALEQERTAIATEREALVKERDDAVKLAQDADKMLKQTLLSHALVTRKDVKDARIVAQLVKLDAVDATPEAVSDSVSKVLKAYPSLTTSGIAPDEVVTTTTQEGLVLRSEAKPIGKAMGQTQEVPKLTKLDMLEKARKKAARSGRAEDRVAYAKLKRKYGQ